MNEVMRKILIGITLLSGMLNSAKSVALGYTPVSTISAYTIGENEVVRVRLNDMGQHSGEELCGADSMSDIEYYSLDLSANNAEKHFSILMASYVSKSGIFFKLNGCLDGRPLINHIYVCEKLWCL